MDTIDIEIKKPFLQGIAEDLLKTKQEIDELVLQLSLGNAVVTVKFEDIKYEFTKNVNSLKQYLHSHINLPIPYGLIKKLEELEHQLQFGKVQSKESFDSQRFALLKATIDLENEIRLLLHKVEVTGYFGHKMEKFLLKLEILHLKFGIKKFEITDEFRKEMNKVKKSIESFNKKAKTLPNCTFEDVKKEINYTYRYLQNAVNKL